MIESTASIPAPHRIGAAALLLVATGMLWSCDSGEPESVADASPHASPNTSPDAPAPATHVTREAPSIPMPTFDETTPQDLPGLHNAVAFHEGFVSGSVPEGEAGFDTLRAMGVRTIISVDGAEPEVALAEARGMRYIHLPIGYNGFDDERKLQLVRATRDALAEGPVYIHCHHGKHRSAGAAATVAASLGWTTPEAGVERMKVAGTAPNYKGLYACASDAEVISPAMIDDVPANFPSVWTPSSFVKAMVEIDEVFEHLKAIEKAGWKTPADHPDLVPAAEAGRLVDLHRVLIEGDYVGRKPAEFAALMLEGQNQSQAIEDLLVAGTATPEALSELMKALNASCKDCHVAFRD